MTPDDMKIWPDEIPEKTGDNFLIWIPNSGFQITRFDRNSSTIDKPAYFYWCGAPKKVWWIKLDEPTRDTNTGGETQ
jgi:hypothetical protein